MGENTEYVLHQIQNVCRDIINKHNLNWGNSEILAENGLCYYVIEAPRNTAITVDLDNIFNSTIEYYKNVDNIEEHEQEIYSKLYNLICSETINTIENFDEEELFIEIWSPTFEIRPFQFMEMLQLDMRYFDSIDWNIETV